MHHTHSLYPPTLTLIYLHTDNTHTHIHTHTHTHTHAHTHTHTWLRIHNSTQIENTHHLSLDNKQEVQMCESRSRPHPHTVLFMALPSPTAGSAKCFPQCIFSVCHLFVVASPVLFGVRRELQIAFLWLQKAPKPVWILRLWLYGRVCTSFHNVCSHTHLHVQIGLLSGCWFLLLSFLLWRCLCLHCRKNEKLTKWITSL